MARSIAQIKESIKATLRSFDNTLDLEVGPLYDYLIAPVPVELVTLENQVERLKRFYSVTFADVASPEEARDFANNFGTGPDAGGFARAQVVYYRTSALASGQDSTIPVGALVGTADSTLIFRVLQSATLYSDFASTNYNTSTSRYEVAVLVEAVAPGQQYNIPVGRISRMVTNVPGFDGVAQLSAANGGSEPEDALTLAQRVQMKFKGLDRNTINGLASLGKQAFSTLIRDIKVVRPTDRLEFRRLTQGPSLDLYVDGVLPQQFTEEFLAIGGEKQIALTTHRTATAVTTVAVNGETLDQALWSFVPDSSLDLQGSTRALPTVRFNSLDSTDPNAAIYTLAANDLVEIIGTKNDLLERLQLLYMSEDSPFQTDILVRSFLDLPIVVNIEVRINSGDPDNVRKMVGEYLQDFIDPAAFGIPTLLVSDTVKEQLRVLIPEIETVKIYEFRRKIGSNDRVEVITPLKNQVPRFDTVASNITVRL